MSETGSQASGLYASQTNAIKPLYDIIKKLSASRPASLENELGIGFTDFKIQKDALRSYKPEVLLGAVALLRGVVLQDPSKDEIRYTENGMPSSHNGIEMPRHVRVSFDEKGALHVTILGTYPSFPETEINKKLERTINKLIAPALEKTLRSAVYAHVGSAESLGKLAQSLTPEQSTELTKCRERLFEACAKISGRARNASLFAEASTYFDTLMGFLNRTTNTERRTATINDIVGGLAYTYDELVGSANKSASASKAR